MVTDLALSVVKVDGLIRKYASIASIHQMASSDSPEKCSGRAALISAVLVAVDMGFAGGRLTGGWEGRTADGCWAGGVVVNVADVTGGFGVVKGMTGGKGFVIGMTIWELGGSRIAHLGSEGKDAGLAVYCHPRTLFEDDKGSGGVLGLVGGYVWEMVARSRGFWEVLTSSKSSKTQKTFLGCWGKILGWLGWSCS